MSCWERLVASVWRRVPPLAVPLDDEAAALPPTAPYEAQDGTTGGLARVKRWERGAHRRLERTPVRRVPRHCGLCDARHLREGATLWRCVDCTHWNAWCAIHSLPVPLRVEQPDFCIPPEETCRCHGHPEYISAHPLAPGASPENP